MRSSLIVQGRSFWQVLCSNLFSECKYNEALKSRNLNITFIHFSPSLTRPRSRTFLLIRIIIITVDVKPGSNWSLFATIYFSITQSRNIYSLNFKRYSFFEQNCPSSAQVSVLTLRLRRRFSMASAIGLRERRRRRLPASDSISAPETISTITVPSRSSPDLSPCPMPHQVRQTMSTIVHQTFLYAQCRIK